VHAAPAGPPVAGVAGGASASLPPDPVICTPEGKPPRIAATTANKASTANTAAAGARSDRRVIAP
jgi:hypothetical protein